LWHGYATKAWALYKLGRCEGALIAADKLIEVAPRYDRFRGYISKAATLNGMGKYEEALAAADKAVELSPNHFQPYYERACINSLLRKKEEMLADLAKSIECGGISEGKSPREWALADADLDNYRDDPDFRRLIYPEEFAGRKRLRVRGNK
jgi:tetratricopeptide (TPR) repeat protein